jgi:hypothetical protein
MRLTHHHRPTRSFIIIIIVVLATVYTAFMLIKLQQRIANNEQTNNSKITNTNLNTETWTSYVDPVYPLNILVPKEWKIEPEDNYSGFYTVNFNTGNRGILKIFISQTGFAGITESTGTTIKTTEGTEFTKYDDWIYTTKVGDYYYTFDATLGINLEKELAEIIRLAKFD